MKGKKILGLVMTTLVASSVAFGCGKKEETPPATEPAKTEAPATEAPKTEEPKQEEVELVYARGLDATGANEKLVARFNELNKGKIKVKFVEMPSDTGKSHDQYVTVFNAKGTDYDVFDADVIWPAEFAQAGYVLPLDQFVERDNIDMSTYMQGPVEALTFKGQLWGMPKFIDAGMLFYRTDVIDKAPATWEELLAAAEASKGKTEFGYLAQAKQYEGLVCNAVEFMSAYGGAVVDGNGEITVDSEGTRKGLEMMKKVLRSKATPGNITTFTETESHTAFIEGKSAFIRNWPYQWALAQDASQSKIVDKVAVTALPKGSVRAAACLGGWVAMINKYSKHPNEAWEFLKFMSGAEGQKITATIGGSAPTLLSVYEDAEVKKNPLFADPNFVAGLSAAVPRPVSPIYPKLSDIMQKEISAYITDAQDLETTVKNMDTKMKAAVADAK